MFNGHNKMQKLFNGIKALHLSQVNGSPKRKLPLTSCLQKVQMISKIAYTVFFGTGVLCWISPVYAYWNDKNEWELSLAMFLPFVQHDTSSGYLTNIVWQVFLEIAALDHVATFENLLVMYILHSIVFVDYLRMDLEELQEILEKEGPKDKTKIKKKMKEVFQNHQKILE